MSNIPSRYLNINFIWISNEKLWSSLNSPVFSTSARYEPESRAMKCEPCEPILPPARIEPQPQAVRLDPKPQAVRVDPKPQAVRPDPKPQAVRPEPRPKAVRLAPKSPPARFEPEPPVADECGSGLLLLNNGYYEPPAPTVDTGIAGCEHCRNPFTESGIYSCKRTHNICANCRQRQLPSDIVLNLICLFSLLTLPFFANCTKIGEDDRYRKVHCYFADLLSYLGANFISAKSAGYMTDWFRCTHIN